MSTDGATDVNCFPIRPISALPGFVSVVSRGAAGTYVRIKPLHKGIGIGMESGWNEF